MTGYVNSSGRMTAMTPRGIYLLTGISAAGKSSVAEALAARAEVVAEREAGRQ
jgi:chloramphenicol 3-O-phosphotransferase